uniref:Uncharacterized protein n=1 Tax=Oryza rufipogon TaxID=4529 RepID=A0A0E0NUP3_ORYRU
MLGRAGALSAALGPGPLRPPRRRPRSPMECDLAWRFRPAEDTNGRTTYYKDNRRFTLTCDVNTCNLVVGNVGEYHSSTGAKCSGRRKGKKGKKGKREAPVTDFVPAKTQMRLDENAANADTTAASEPGASCRRGKYLIYMGGGERCKSVNHYVSPFLCALGEDST